MMVVSGVVQWAPSLVEKRDDVSEVAGVVVVVSGVVQWVLGLYYLSWSQCRWVQG